MVKIILLGRCCRISFDFIKINLKEKNSVFEWVWTDTLTEINTVISKIINNQPLNIYRENGNDYIEDTNIVTSHYINRDYKEILSRRAKRFYDDIKEHNEILFVRDDVLGTINYDEILQFYKLIHQINPNLVFKLLLLSEKNKYNPIKYDNLYHKIYSFSELKNYINECISTYYDKNHTTD